MPKLNPELHIKLDKTSVQAILDIYSLKLRSFRLAKKGIENTTCLVATATGKFALRVYRKNRKFDADILQELAFMNFLAKRGLPVPKIFANDEKEQITRYKQGGVVWRCVLMEQMAGDHPKRYSDKLIQDLAWSQARMHKLGVLFAHRQKHKPPFNYIFREKYFLPKIDFNKITLPQVQAILNRVKKYRVSLDPKLPHGFNHLDIAGGNILVKNNKLSAIFDFDDLAYSPIVICLAYTMVDILLVTKNSQAVFQYLAEYQKVRKLNQLELNSVQPLMLFRCYVIGALEIAFWGEQGNFVKVFLNTEKTISTLSFG